MNSRKLFPCVIFSCLFSLTFGQMGTLVGDLPELKWDKTDFIADLTDEEKMDRLGKFLPNDSVQFEDASYDPEYPEDNRYLPLNLAGLYFLDLNGNGQLDLLYSGSSGPMGLVDTKVYYLTEGKYVYHRMLRGKIIHMQRSGNGILEVLTHWKPCCDSYTSRIERHHFSDIAKAEFASSISIIGRLMQKLETPIVEEELVKRYRTNLYTWRDFSGLKKGHVEQIELFAFKLDFRGTSPSFRHQYREIKKRLHFNQPISLLTMNVPAEVQVITEQVHEGETWYLVLTDILDNVPRPPASLYEWSAGNQRQFIGWTQHVQLE